MDRFRRQIRYYTLSTADGPHRGRAHVLPGFVTGQEIFSVEGSTALGKIAWEGPRLVILLMSSVRARLDV